MELVKIYIKEIKKKINETKDTTDKFNLLNLLLDFSKEIDEIRSKFIIDLNEKYEYCFNCGKWYPKELFEKEIEQELYKSTPLDYPNSNDIRDYKFGDKELEKEYHICPICKKKRLMKTITTKYVYNGKEYNLKDYYLKMEYNK